VAPAIPFTSGEPKSFAPANQFRIMLEIQPSNVVELAG
jgi:hypothetical protein